MPVETALNQALEALTLAAESGGELDRDIYVEARRKLEIMMQAVVSYDAKIGSEDRPPEGDDYNQLLAILEIEVGATKKMLMNLQGMTFTEEQARDYYGARFASAQLVWVTVNEDGQVVEGRQA